MLTPAWITTAEQYAGYVGGLLTALSGAKAATPSASTASNPSAGLGLSLGITTPIDAIASAIGDALQLANTITGAKDTPQYIAAVAAQNDQNDTDEILQAVSTGDLDTLRRMSSL